MKNSLSGLAQEKEAAFWESIKKMMLQNPGKLCRK